MQRVGLRGSLGRLVQQRVVVLQMMGEPRPLNRVRPRVMVVIGRLLVLR